jgi:hypothetical protein
MLKESSFVRLGGRGSDSLEGREEAPEEAVGNPNTASNFCSSSTSISRGLIARGSREDSLKLEAGFSPRNSDKTDSDLTDSKTGDSGVTDSGITGSSAASGPGITGSKVTSGGGSGAIVAMAKSSRLAKLSRFSRFSKLTAFSP